MSSPFSRVEPWDIVADGYDRHFLETSAEFSRRAVELVVSTETPARILDVACGPGTTESVLSSTSHEVDAIDFSEQMVERLRVKLEDGRFGKATVRAQVMDGQELQFAEDTFDAAVSMFGLMFFPDRHRGFQEILRVLKPGGRACVSSWLPFSDVPAMRWMFGAIGHISPPPPKDAPPRQPVLEDPKTFAQELCAAGFVEVEVIRHDATLMVPSLADFWEAMVRSSAPLAMLRRNVGEEKWQVLSEQGKQYLVETAPRDLDELTMSAWLGVGSKPS